MPPLMLPPRPRILVVSLRRIGDVLLTTPLIRSLKHARPQGTIDVLVFDGAAGILAGNPDIDRVIGMSERPGIAQTLRLIAGLCWRYDLAISTQTGDRPTFYAAIAGRKHAGMVTADGSLGDYIKRAVLDRHAVAADRVHRVEQQLRLCDAIDVARVPELVAPAAADASDIASSDYAVVHAAPMFRYKEWTREGWRALAQGLGQRGLSVIATGGPREAEHRYLREVWRDSVPIHQLSWPKLTGLLKRACVYVGPDTSVTHLAAAVGCPTVALFGPIDPRVWGPWPVGGLNEPWAASGTVQNRGNVWLVQNPLPCLPCTFEGCERRIDSASACLDELAPAQVLAAVDRALALRRPQ